MKRYLHFCVHYTFIHNGQIWERHKCPSKDKWIKEMWYIHIVVCYSGEGNGTHSSTIAWKIPWMEEPGGLQSIGSRRVGLDWSDLAAAAGRITASDSLGACESSLSPAAALWLQVGRPTLQIRPEDWGVRSQPRWGLQPHVQLSKSPSSTRENIRSQ